MQSNIYSSDYIYYTTKPPPIKTTQAEPIVIVISHMPFALRVE